jgi:3-oxoadipate enol-lactonase
VIDGSLTTGSVRLHYRITGEGPHTLVLVNGVGDDVEAWANQVDDLTRAQLQVVSFDNRGVGLSGQPPGPYSTREMSEDLKALAIELGLGTFHLAGVSMGGAIAQEYAIAHGEDLVSLVLANTYAAADPFSRTVFENWAVVAEANGMAVMADQQAPWIYSPAFYEEQPERVEDLIREAQKSTQPPSAFAAQIAALVDHDARARLGELSTPTLVIAADSDITIRPALSHRLYEAIPHASWITVPGGHAAFWEAPKPWNRAVIEFVRAHGAS